MLLIIKPELKTVASGTINISYTSRFTFKHNSLYGDAANAQLEEYAFVWHECKSGFTLMVKI